MYVATPGCAWCANREHHARAGYPISRDKRTSHSYFIVLKRNIDHYVVTYLEKHSGHRGKKKKKSLPSPPDPPGFEPRKCAGKMVPHISPFQYSEKHAFFL